VSSDALKSNHMLMSGRSVPVCRVHREGILGLAGYLVVIRFVDNRDGNRR
jgi:hypothetical protein